MRTKIMIAGPTAFALALSPVPLPIGLFTAGVGLLGLSACAGGTAAVQTDITDTVNAVVAGVQTACQVSPLASDVARLIPVYGPNVAAIINAICGAVKVAKASGKLGGQIGPNGIRVGVAPVNVHGVVVHFE